MEEWEIPLVVKNPHTGKIISINGVYVANRKHIRFSILLMFMALVGGALVEFDGNSALEDCDQGGIYADLGVLLFGVSLFGIIVNGVIFLFSLIMPEFSRGEVLMWSIFHIAVLLLSILFFGEGLMCHNPISVAPNYDIGAGF